MGLFLRVKSYLQKNPEILESQSNQILTAIVNGMRKEEPSDHVRLAACNALLNSLEFTRNNFSKEVFFETNLFEVSFFLLNFKMKKINKKDGTQLYNANYMRGNSKRQRSNKSFSLAESSQNNEFIL